MRQLRDADAAAAHVVLPSVVEALEAPANDLTVREPRRAVSTPVVQASQRSVVAAEENEAMIVDREPGRACRWKIFDERDRIPALPPVERGRRPRVVCERQIQQGRFSVRRASTVKKPGK